MSHYHRVITVGDRGSGSATMDFFKPEEEAFANEMFEREAQCSGVRYVALQRVDSPSGEARTLREHVRTLDLLEADSRYRSVRGTIKSVIQDLRG